MAIDWFCKWSGSPNESYTESHLYDIVLINFLDFIDTADKPSMLIRQFLDARRLRSYCPIKREQNAAVIEDMLTALMMVRVKDNDGNYINGFTKDIEL